MGGYIVNVGSGRWQRLGSGVVIVIGGIDSIRGKNRLDSPDPPCQKWGMHEGGGYFEPEAGGRDRRWIWEGVIAAGPSVVA